MNEITECCDHAAVYYIWEKSDGSLGYEPWDFCPECLECCSLYDPQKQDRMKQLTEGANNDTIARAHKRLAKKLGFGRRIAYVTVFSTHHNNASPEMTKHAIELDARLVDEWLMSKHEGDEYVCKKCKS